MTIPRSMWALVATVLAALVWHAAPSLAQSIPATDRAVNLKYSASAQWDRPTGESTERGSPASHCARPDVHHAIDRGPLGASARSEPAATYASTDLDQPAQCGRSDRSGTTADEDVGGASANHSFTATGVAAETGGDDVTRVGRWMGKSELDQMQNTGRVVEGGGGRTYVGTTPDPSDYKAGTGYYVEFDVPSRSLHPASRPNWAQIPGPNVGTTRFGPIPRGMPPARNIQVVRGP